MKKFSVRTEIPEFVTIPTSSIGSDGRTGRVIEVWFDRVKIAWPNPDESTSIGIYTITKHQILPVRVER